MSAELLPGESSPLEAFDAFKRRRPEIKPALVQAARDHRTAHGLELDIHAAYSLVVARGVSFCRSWLPAFACEIEAETELRFSTRPSAFDGMEPLL